MNPVNRDKLKGFDSLARSTLLKIILPYLSSFNAVAFNTEISKRKYYPTLGSNLDHVNQGTNTAINLNIDLHSMIES